MISLSHILEPRLEFGGSMRHIDMRSGLASYGPFDAPVEGHRPPITLGIVGSQGTVDGLARWITTCEGGVAAKESRQPNLFPTFPGLSPDGPFRCDFRTDPAMQQVIPARTISKLVAEPNPERAIRGIAEALAAEVEALASRNRTPDVVLCALPLEFIEKAVQGPTPPGEEEDDYGERPHADPDLNLRSLLKWHCMRHRLPIQIVWPTTYDSNASIARKLKKQSNRTVQDEATRAWNFFCALYYKAGGLPWRLLRDPVAPKTSYVGVSFYRSLDGERLLTSTAQMFDERGEGLILRGGRAVESKVDRSPHLSEEDSYALLRASLRAYRSEHHHYPARVVIHKTSRFDDAEIAGFSAALEESEIDFSDFVTISKSKIRAMRMGNYPPLRGTIVNLSKEQSLVYTRGSVEYYRTYPGMYVPSPLLLTQRNAEQPVARLAEEILALSKMNWNNTQFDGGEPITIRAAKYVGAILKYVPEGDPVAPRYSFYM